jgi:hypothetical protein
VPASSYRAFLDESSANRGEERQEYLVCAALIDVDACDNIREQLRPLLLPGQIKFHWTDESDRRLVAVDVFDLMLECRSDSQDKSDRAHIVALQNQGLDRRVRIGHQRGGDEPLLWIADTVLGAINSEYLGDSAFISELRATLLIEERTPASLQP